MKNNGPQRTHDSPLYLTPAARVQILQECGLGSGWVLLTMTEHGTIAQNVRAYKEERAQLLAAAYALRDALENIVPKQWFPMGDAPNTVAMTLGGSVLTPAFAALALPLPPRPVTKPSTPPST